MKISVALAAFNGERYIIEQLESIYKQTRKPDEVVISDDNSTDSTKHLVKEYINRNNLSNWRLVNNNRSNGVTYNFINALEHVTGDIVFLCDQDDVWEIYKIETMADSFDDDTMCVISAVRYIDQDGKSIVDKTSYTNKKTHTIDLPELCCVCSYLGMSSAFRKEVMDYTEESFMTCTSHDWAIMVKASERGKIKYIGKELQRYRQHSDNASIIKTGTRAERRLAFIERQKDIIYNTRNYEDIQERLIVLDDYVRFKDRRMAWIKNRAPLFIICNFKKYFQMKYTFRNIMADFFASLR